MKVRNNLLRKYDFNSYSQVIPKLGKLFFFVSRFFINSVNLQIQVISINSGVRMIYQDDIYGTVKLEDTLSSLMDSTPFQRLKKIHQGGPVIIAQPNLNHTRFEHSVGVMILIKKLGGSLSEQIAGLLHDISHTTFSHLVDYVLEYEDEDYHEEIYPRVVSHPEICNILSKNGLSVDTFLNLEKFTLLEYPLPGLCADRIDYTLRDLHRLNQISNDEIDWFLNGLVVSDNRICVQSKIYAEWFKEKYTYLIEEFFNGLENRLSQQFMKSIIQKYYQTNQLTKNDFDQDDFFLISKIETLEKNNINVLYKNWLAADNDKETLKTKKRVVDPEVLLNGQVVKLSQME